MSILSLWQKLSGVPGGQWLFSKGVCVKAPFFSSIHPLVTDLRPGRCEVHVQKRRAVLNHLGTVHAIALCNMAELSGGLLTDASIPATHRWIPKGMTVEYLKKAVSDVVAVASPAGELASVSEPCEYPVNVSVRDRKRDEVFRARITMWVTPKKS